MKKKLELTAQLHNRFDIEVRDAVTGELKQRARAFNVICDGLWDLLFSTNSSGTRFSTTAYFQYVHYGDGSGTPAASDTTLFNSVGYKSVSPEMNYDKIANGIIYATASITLQSTEAVGKTLTEVGLGRTTSNIVTHALFEDMQGNPTSITKTDTDVVRIYATVYLHFAPEGFSNSSIQPYPSGGLWKHILGDTSSSASSNLCYVGVVAVSSLRNVGTNGKTMTCQADRANKKMIMTARLEATDANRPIKGLIIKSRILQNAPSSWTDSGVSSILFVAPGGWFTPPPIVGEEVGTGDGTTTDFSTAFPIRSNPTIKVDGVAAQATVRVLGAETADSAYSYFNPVDGLSSEGTVRYKDSGAISLNVPFYIENPYYTTGIASMYLHAQSSGANVEIYASNDLETWDLIYDSYIGNNSYKIFEIPAAYQSKRFFEILKTSGSGSLYFENVVCNGYPGNIHFATPPAAGSVITCDYVPDCIAKDSDHVFDLTVELTFGEYTPT